MRRQRVADNPLSFLARLPEESLSLSVLKNRTATNQEGAVSLLPHVPNERKARYPSDATPKVEASSGDEQAVIISVFGPCVQF